MNRAADAGDDEQHEQAERVEAKTEVNLQVSDREPVESELGFFRVTFEEQARAENKGSNNCRDGYSRAQSAMLLREKRNDRCREEREK